MSVQPTTRSTFASTIWNSPGKAMHSTNAAKFGGPNVKITEGSKVQFGSGDLIWDVVRIFEDGTMHLSTVSSGQKRTMKVPPSSKSWTNLWMVDGRRLRNLGDIKQVQEKSRGGGPNRNIEPGEVVTLGNSSVRWVVQSILRDGTLNLQTFNGQKVTNSVVGPRSKFWNSIYSISG